MRKKKDYEGIYPNFYKLYDFKNKEKTVNHIMKYMLIRTMQMFEYDGLPDTLHARTIELNAQTTGGVGIIEHNGKLYAVNGGLGGEPDPDYLPTLFTVANPALKLSKTYEIDKNCVIIPNDTLYMGLLPLFNKYATLMSENELTMRVGLINSRILSILSAQDERTQRSAEAYLSNIEDGDLGVISENAFLDGIRTNEFSKSSNSGVLTNLIEMEQYLKASLFNELGIQSNYNMKRESINSDESQLDSGALLPLADDMLDNRKKAIKKINKMFGTSITVRFSSAWEDVHEDVNNTEDNNEEQETEDNSSESL